MRYPQAISYVSYFQDENGGLKPKLVYRIIHDSGEMTSGYERDMDEAECSRIRQWL